MKIVLKVLVGLWLALVAGVSFLWAMLEAMADGPSPKNEVKGSPMGSLLRWFS